MKRIYYAVVLPVLVLMSLGAARAQEINGGFEQWRMVLNGNQMPVGWSAYSFACGKGELARSGASAVTIWNWYTHAQGVLMLGGPESQNLPSPFEQTGLPISFKPARLVGYYRYLVGELTSGPTDSAIVVVVLKKYNHTKRSADTVGLATHYLTAAGEYTPFTVDITDMAPGVTPDSIAICFISSTAARCADNTCCYLSIDDLELSAPSGVRYGLDRLLQEARVYPNPTSGNLRIEWATELERPHLLRVYSIAGTLVGQIGGVRGVSTTFDGGGLPPGQYLFDLLGDGGAVAARGRFLIE